MLRQRIQISESSFTQTNLLSVPLLDFLQIKNLLRLLNFNVNLLMYYYLNDSG